METVWCLSSSSYADQPLAFTWQGVRIQVQVVIQRWRSVQGMNFQVQAEDGKQYNLFYDESLDSWSIGPAG